jgi:hypothetical protein
MTRDLIVYTDRTSKSVVPSLKSVQRLNCPTMARPPPVVEDYTTAYLDYVIN